LISSPFGIQAPWRCVGIPALDEPKPSFHARQLNPQHPVVGFCLTHKVESPIVCLQKRDFLSASREYKTDIKKLSTQKAFDTLKELDPVEFAYKADSQEKHVGFIAEDAPELVATKDKKGMSSMDVVAVLTKVVQEQQRMMQDQQRTITELSEKVAQLQTEARLEKMP